MIQVIQAQQREPKRSFGQKLSEGIGRGLDVGSQLMEAHNQKQAISKEDASVLKEYGINLSGIKDPKIRQEVINSSLKGKNEIAERARKLQSNEGIIKDLEQRNNLPKGSLSAYRENPAMAEKVSRPQKENKKTQASQPIDPDQLERINNVRKTPEFNEMDEVDQYRALTNAGVSKENAEAESKLTGGRLERKSKEFESSYKAQEDFINKTTDSFRAFEENTKPRLLQMQNIKDADLIGPTANVFLDSLGIPLGALDDPASELYNKLSLDLLKGLPETYGNRILKVEVDNFLKTIPSLMNSADGRRMISSNMLKLGEMKEVYYNEMRKQQVSSIDNRKPLSRDFQQRVFDQVKPQIDRINNEFVKLSEIKSVPKDTIPFFGPTGEVEFVPKEHAEWASQNGGRRVW